MSDPASDTTAEPHPWYGPCDGLMPDGECAECHEVATQPGYATHKKIWYQDMADMAQRRKERKATRVGLDYGARAAKAEVWPGKGDAAITRPVHPMPLRSDSSNFCEEPLRKTYIGL